MTPEERADADRKWWEDMIPTAQLHGWTYRHHATFIFNNREYVEVSGKSAEAIAASAREKALEDAAAACDRRASGPGSYGEKWAGAAALLAKVIRAMKTTQPQPKETTREPGDADQA